MVPPTSTAPLGTVHGRDRVVQDILELRARRDYQPLKLRIALEQVSSLGMGADPQLLDYALQELGVALIGTLERIRTACPELGGPPPP